MPLDYSYTAPGIVSQLAEACAKNAPVIHGPLAGRFRRIERSVDLQAKLLGQIIGIFGSGFAPKSYSERLALGLYHKTILGHFAALQLLDQGLFGPARPLLRHAFESYVLAKYFIIAEDETLARRWERAELYVLGRDVFGKIRSPDIEPIRRFWGVLSNHTHASIVSLQGTADVGEPDHRSALEETIVQLELVLQCGFHVLNSHLITRSMVWYASYYYEEDHIPELRREIREVFKEASLTFNTRARYLIRCFRRTWVLDEAPTHAKLRYVMSNRARA